MMQQTVVIVKPDGMVRDLDKIIKQRIKTINLSIKHQLKIRFNKADIEFIYRQHINKPFFNTLVSFMSSTECSVFIVEGNNAVSRMNEIVGSTQPQFAQNGTIRHEFYQAVPVIPNLEGIIQNTIHSSDVTNAEREVKYFNNLRKMLRI